MERGNALEIKEIKRFYGAVIIKEVLNQKSDYSDSIMRDLLD
jgi:hypothetical protein